MNNVSASQEVVFSQEWIINMVWPGSVVDQGHLIRAAVHNMTRIVCVSENSNIIITMGGLRVSASRFFSGRFGFVTKMLSVPGFCLYEIEGTECLISPWA